MFIFVHSFFFCKQKTAYEMRISDWSSDVCSSDLQDPFERPVCHVHQRMPGRLVVIIIDDGSVLGTGRVLSCENRRRRSMVPESLRSPTSASRRRQVGPFTSWMVKSLCHPPCSPLLSTRAPRGIGRASCGARGCRSGENTV